jgi:predicted ATPase/DNA-binding XRE family transcriptional regulator
MSGEPASFGTELRRLRARAALSQEDLAERAGLSARGISDLERGVHRAPHLATVRLLADTLGLDAAERSALLAAARPEAPPTPPALPERPLLPPALTPFLGRQAEVAAVVALVQDPTTRLVTLTGPGGIGKTRLAVRVGQEVARNYPDGVIFVDLAPLHDPALVLPSVATALGIREAPGRPLAELIAAFLRARSTLLILDNFEHLVEAAPVVTELLAAAPGVTALVTSRAPLRLRGEQEYPVPPLPLPETPAVTDLATIAANEAVAFFTAHARAARPDFHLTPETAHAVVAICRELDGVPLALELAAARIKVLPPAALLTRLAHRLPLLTGGARDAPARQRTLRDTIRWSYDLLSPDEQRLFRRLGVFAGGWTLEAAADIVNPPAGLDVLDGLTSLIDKSLVRLSDTGAAPRYGMLETIREYALERLAASGEEGTTRARHAASFATLAELAEPGFFGPEERGWLDHCQAEFGNMRAALAWTADGGDPVVGLRLGAALRWFWITREGLVEGCDWLERLLSRGVGAPADVRAKALLVVGVLRHLQPEDAKAARAAQESLALYQGDADAFGTARALLLLGVLDQDQGRVQCAEARLTQARETFHVLGATVWEANALFWLGTGALVEAADLDRARSLLEQAVQLYREVGYGSGVAMALANLGGVALAQGDLERAEAVGREALVLGWERGDRFRVAEQFEELAFAAAVRGDGERAARLGGAAEAIGETIGLAVARAYGAQHDSFVKTVQTRLGTDRMAEAWQAGRALPLQHVIAEALATVDERVDGSGG